MIIGAKPLIQWRRMTTPNGSPTGSSMLPLALSSTSQTFCCPGYHSTSWSRYMKICMIPEWPFPLHNSSRKRKSPLTSLPPPHVDINYIFPFSLPQCLFLTWCMLPMANNGSILIYHRLIKPFVKKHEKELDSAFDSAGGLMRDAAGKGYLAI